MILYVGFTSSPFGINETYNVPYVFTAISLHNIQSIGHAHTYRHSHYQHAGWQMLRYNYTAPGILTFTAHIPVCLITG